MQSASLQNMLPSTLSYAEYICDVIYRSESQVLLQQMVVPWSLHVLKRCLCTWLICSMAVSGQKAGWHVPYSLPTF